MYPPSTERFPGNLSVEGTSPDPAPRKRFPGNLFPGAENKFKLFFGRYHPGSHSIKPDNWTAILAVTQSNQSTGQPSWQSLNQTSQLDSHPGSHSIKPVNWTAILAATQSNQPVNHGGRQADLKGGSGGRQPPQEIKVATFSCASELC